MTQPRGCIQVALVSVATGAKVHVVQAGSAPVVLVRFAPGGSLCAVALESKAVVVLCMNADGGFTDDPNTLSELT